MNREPRTPTTKNPEAWFTGDVWLDMIAAPREEYQRMNVATVRFAPGARTAWHSHARGQFLRIEEGVARLGTRDGQVIEVTAGETIYTPPGEEHWHGAAPDAFMQHLAMFESGDDPATSTVWAEHVTDEQYGVAPTAER